MTRGTIFWVIMIILFVLGVAAYWGHTGSGPYWGMGMSVVQYVLLALLGWSVFGPAIRKD